MAGKQLSHDDILSRAAAVVGEQAAAAAARERERAAAVEANRERVVQRMATARAALAALRTASIDKQCATATRAEMIPTGDCVENGPAAELFTRLDAGDAEATLPAMDACRRCGQLALCYERMAHIAGPILNAGVAVTVVGGVEWRN